MKPGAPLVHPAETFSPRASNILQPITAFSRGDVDAALAGARTSSRRRSNAAVDIAFLEPKRAS